LAELGIDANTIANVIKTQNAVTPAGMIETSTDNVYMRVTGMFDDIEAIRNLPIRGNSKTFRLADIATVDRRYVEPAEPKMFYNGQEAIGIAVSMESGGNILTLGDNLNNIVANVKKDLPLGLEINPVSDQPLVVKEAISDFVSTLREAIIIVLAVSFLSLGWRTGLVVACCIPLVLTGVFCAMQIMSIDLQKVSLGALIIALGLLVDDAIIAVEMMSVKLEEGCDRFSAACYAYSATAMPMLTGTLITCAGFIPVAFSKGMAAEFTKALFPVIGIALLISWVVSVMVAPLFGYKLIKVKVHKEDGKIDPYQSKFYKIFKKILILCLDHRKLILGATFVSFCISVYMMQFIKQEFFPPSLRPEIIVEMTLPEGSSIKSTETEAKRFAAFLDQETGDIKNYSYYVGEGAPRFVLTTEPVLPAKNYAQFVVVSKDVASRKALTAKINEQLDTKFPNVRGNIKFIQTGPPAAYPIMLRVSGYDHEKVREIAGRVSEQMAQNPNIEQINYDWNEKSKVMHLTVDQDKLRNMGITGEDLSKTLYTQLSGASVAEYYEKDRTIDIVFKLKDDDRSDLAKVKDIPIYLGKGGYVPLEQIAKISYDAEDGLVWRRNLEPTITIRANIISGTANDETQKAYAATQAIRADLPMGYSIDVDGALANSNDSMKFLMVPIPIMLITIITLLMFQLRSMSLMFLTLMTAPLGLIGVSIGMLVTNQAMGFVAELGILALSGMIIRNAVILIDQIQKHIAEGEDQWDAIIDSAVLRFRPIMLTAAAAILGMMPLIRNTFWGPMAVAIASGLFLATILTLLVLPTMYASWFRVKKNKEKTD
jgi:multidrug efflux pump subunit AcrB